VLPMGKLRVVSFPVLFVEAAAATSPGTLRAISLLFPGNLIPSPGFQRVRTHGAEHQRLLGDLQRFRGRIALEEKAISPWQVTSDGRHVQPADDSAIHLVGTDYAGEVVSCMRYLPHRNTTHWTKLMVFHTPLAADERWRPVLEEAIVTELERARCLNYSYVEMGGWVIARELRRSLEAARMVVTAYALARFQGGALGITTATTKHGSSSVLRRLGGRSLCALGTELPVYYDPQYECEMEILRFDSSRPGKHCADGIQHYQDVLAEVPVILPEPVKANPLALPEDRVLSFVHNRLENHPAPQIRR
jgi:hypothetical protein